ncbi:hypothetical protein PGT21_035622 [Puccinia graminis f. sp. tritici]|uniref:Uncharacterized protein n=1 Tax=Puccinia graminis f. sp. tritici TaxID=56615 RepID=A0A5B0PGK9_PUCGR|nr:hypothetical protein PGT21_035622 [Puccinia graminis f. sp. tritici]KAA1100311.1 hypothetical protein PGTUg99_013485 [Puccinia graminis f. sp. tritici]
MAQDYDIASAGAPKRRQKAPETTPDIFSKGLKFIADDFSQGGSKINRFSPATALLYK